MLGTGGADLDESTGQQPATKKRARLLLASSATEMDTPAPAAPASAAAAAAAAGCTVYDSPFHCPLCLKHIRRSTLAPRLAHVASCALLNGVDVARARDLAGCRPHDWEMFTRTQAAAPTTQTTTGGSPAGKPPTGSSSSTPLLATKKRKAAATSKPLTLDSALASTRAGSGVGTALAHVKQARKSGPPSSVGSGLASGSAPSVGGSEARWELANGVFLLGEHFVVPNPPHTQHSVEQLERMSDADAPPAAREDAAAGAASIAASSTPAAAASPHPASSLASISSQLYSWRHYLHEMDQFMLQMETRRQWALVRYRLLQERLASEGGGALPEDMRLNTDVTSEPIDIEPTPAPSPSATPSASSLWHKHGSSSSTLAASSFIGQLPLQNRRDAPHVPQWAAAPVQAFGTASLPVTTSTQSLPPMMPAAARSIPILPHPSPATPPAAVAPINIWAKASSTPVRQSTVVQAPPPPILPAVAAAPLPGAHAVDPLPLYTSSFAKSLLLQGGSGAPSIEPALTQAISYEPSQGTLTLTQPHAQATPMELEPTNGPRFDEQATPSAASPPRVSAAFSAPPSPLSAPVIVLPVFVPSPPADLMPTDFNEMKRLPSADQQRQEQQQQQQQSEQQPSDNSLPMPFALTPDDFMLTPEPSVIKMTVEDALDLVSPPRSQHQPAAAAATVPMTTPIRPEAEVDVDLKEPDTSAVICIPETPTHSCDVTGAVDTSAETIALEQQKPGGSSAPPLFAVADLLADEGVAMDDQDSMFSLSQPSTHSSQPGLERHLHRQQQEEEERKEEKNDKRVERAEWIFAEEMPPLERADECKQQMPSKSTSFVASSSGVVAATASFVSARAIIELLSDGDEDQAPASKETTPSHSHVNKRSQARSYHNDSMDGDAFPMLDESEQEEAEVLIVKVSPSLHKSSVSGYRSGGNTPTESKSIFASAGAASAGSNGGGAPAQWQPASARKLYDRPPSASGTAAAVGLPSPTPVSIAPPIAASAAASFSLPLLPAVMPPAPIAAARPPLPPAVPAAVAAGVAPPSRCSFTSSSSSLLGSFGACCMPAFDSFTVDELKSIMATFGLKQKSRNQMSMKLQELWILMAKKKNAGQALAPTVAPAVAADPAAVAPQPKEKKSRKKKAEAAAASSPLPLLASPAPPLPTTPILAVPSVPPVAAAAASDSEAKSKKRKVAASSRLEGEASQAHEAVSSPPAVGSSAFDEELIGGLPSSVACRIRDFLRRQTDLHVRILLFQPLDLGDLAFVLQEVGGIRLNPIALRNFLDQEGVVTQATQAKDEGRHRDAGEPKPKKGGAHKPRHKRARR